MKVSVAQSCPTLCDPMDCSPPGSSVHGILKARILEWVAIPFPGDIPNPGMEPGSPALQVDSTICTTMEAEVGSNVRLSASWEEAGTANVQELGSV